MTPQRAFLLLGIVSGLAAGILYHATTQRTAVFVAAAQLAPGRAISAADIDTRWLPPDAVPTGAVAAQGDAIGRYPRAPLWPGQLLLTAALAESSAAFDSGLRPPTGYRAIAVPVSAHLALGGAIAPGARVDVIAVSSAEGSGMTVAELVSEAALVVDVRGEHGGPLVDRSAGPGIAPRERLGSVVLAVGASEGFVIAERIPRSTFVLVLVPAAP